MLESILGFLGIDIGNEVPETTEVSENREVRNNQGIEYMEGDIERIEKTSDIMKEIFTDEVISNWDNFSLEEKNQLLNEYYARCGEALGIDAKGIIVDDLWASHGEGVLGLNNGNGYLMLDYRLFMDSANLGQLLDTTTHEMRHQLQSDAIKNPERFPDIPQETIDAWEYNWRPENYIDGNYDMEGYLNQPLERDANAFAEEVLAEYMEGRVQAYAELPAEAIEGEQMDDLEMQTPMGELPSEGLEANSELNAAASYTPAQCAKVSSGTQNYCLFAGSGR